MARRPNKLVSRELIIKEAKIITDEHHLAPFISLLKRHVLSKDSIKDYYGRRGEAIPEGLENLPFLNTCLFNRLMKGAR